MGIVKTGMVGTFYFLNVGYMCIDMLKLLKNVGRFVELFVNQWLALKAFNTIYCVVVLP